MRGVKSAADIQAELDRIEDQIKVYARRRALARMSPGARQARLAEHATAVTPRRGRTPGADLSERQVEILRLLGQGLTQAGVSQRLGCSPNTVSLHLARARARLGVSTTAMALTVVRTRGLIPAVGHREVS